MYGYGNSMFLATHGILARGGAPSPSLLLDTYSGAAAAYSLRRLRTAYTGNAIRVRRSSDNAEQDIGFSGNDLDTTSMLDFVGYNLWNYSEDISQAVWSKNFLVTSGTPPYIDVETAPDGTLTGDKMIESTSVGYSHFITRQTTPITIGASYNLSLYLKQGERTTVSVSSNIAGTSQSCRINLTNGNISSNTFANTPTVTAEANGWYRFSVTIVAGIGNATQSIGVGLINASGQSVYTGDGISGAYVWGFQLSQTSSVKTYQKTVATAAGNGFVTTWYDQSGNGVNATQSTAANQPQIVSSGVLISVNSNNAIRFNSKFLTFSTTGSLPSNISVFAVRNLTTYPTSYNTLFNYKTYGLTHNLNGGPAYGVAHIFSNSTSQASLDYPTITGQALDFIFNKANLERNNFVATLPTGNVYAAGSNSIGSWSGTSQLFNGEIQELVIYESNQNTNKAGIKSNINSFYTIY